MKDKELYDKALKELNEKQADYEEKGIMTYAYTEGIALFLLAISPNKVLHITEYTPWKIKARVKPEVTPEGIELKFNLFNVTGKLSSLSSLLLYLTSVRDAMYMMQNVIDAVVNKEKTDKALGIEEETEND